MGKRRRVKVGRANRGAASLRRWRVHGFTRGVITLPNGALDLGGGWTLYPVNDAAKSPSPFLILESHNSMTDVRTPHEWPSLRLSGTVDASSREEALIKAQGEMEVLVGLLALSTSGTFEEVAGLSIALADSGKDAELRTNLIRTPVEPISADEIENMVRVCGWWRSLANENVKAAIRRALAWYRLSTVISQHGIRNTLLWSSAEALTHAFPEPKAPRNCRHCRQPLMCASCGQPSTGEPFISVKALLVHRYGVMEAPDYDDFAKGRNARSHGGYGPNDRPGPSIPWLNALISVIALALRDLSAGIEK